MVVTPRSIALALAGAALLALGAWACGGEDICLSCDPDATPTPTAAISVSGNVSRFTTFVSDPTTVTVIVCLDLESGQQVENCPKIYLTGVDEDFSFGRTGIEPGPETVFFWIDQNMNGTIEPTDPQARLSDPRDQLLAVGAGAQVTLANAVVDFNSQTASATISVNARPSGTPAPSRTPAP